MNVLFGSEKLEKLTSKFVIQFAGYLSDKNIDRIAINDLSKIPSKDTDLMSNTTINFTEVDMKKKFKLECHHANDMSCSNWELKEIE